MAEAPMNKWPRPRPGESGPVRPTTHKGEPDREIHRDPRGSDDPRRLKVHREPPRRDVPYVPTDDAVVAAMLRFGAVTAGDVVYDLGCGDGRIVVAAARQCGARGVGVDIDPQRIQESRENAARAGVADRSRFHCQSFFDTDLRDATVVMVYLLPAINRKLRPKFLTELRPGARIIANYFDMGDWEPDIRADVHHRVLLQWVVPAWVAGRWDCRIDGPDGVSRFSGRHRMRLHLRRKYQVVTGTATVGRRDYPVRNGRLFGDRLTFKLCAPTSDLPAARFACKVEGRYLRGTCQTDAVGVEHTAVPWGAVWNGG